MGAFRSSLQRVGLYQNYVLCVIFWHWVISFPILGHRCPVSAGCQGRAPFALRHWHLSQLDGGLMPVILYFIYMFKFIIKDKRSLYRSESVIIIFVPLFFLFFFLGDRTFHEMSYLVGTAVPAGVRSGRLTISTLFPC